MSKGKGWLAPPPVMVVSGSEEFLRERELRRAKSAARVSGRRVVEVAAGDRKGLAAVFSGGMLFQEDVLVLLDSAVVKAKKAPKRKRAPSEDGGAEDGPWLEEDLDVVLAHEAEGSTEVCLLIRHDGEATPTSFAGMIAAKLPKGRHIAYAAPKPWDAKDAAVKFLIAECARREKSISEGLAAAVVRQVGTDLGMLSFEAMKVSMLLDAGGRKEIAREDLVGLVASFGSEDWQILNEALASRNAKALVRVLADIRKGPSSDAIVKVCVIAGTSVMKWLHTAALAEEGIEGDDAAARVGTHPFKHRLENVPAARAWGQDSLVELLRGIVAVERGAKRGHVDPWIWLESRLLLAMRGDEHPPVLPGL